MKNLEVLVVGPAGAERKALIREVQRLGHTAVPARFESMEGLEKETSADVIVWELNDEQVAGKARRLTTGAPVVPVSQGPVSASTHTSLAHWNLSAPVVLGDSGRSLLGPAINFAATQGSLQGMKTRSHALEERPRAIAPIGAAPAAAAPTTRRGRQRHVDLVVIGISTGGPEALRHVVPKLTRGVGAPVLIVQHMPVNFTTALASMLDAESSLTVREAEDGDELKSGRVLIAPGGHHMVVDYDGGARRVRLNDGPLVNSCRPAVDVLMNSIVEAQRGRSVLACIMTGMGSDGLNGVRGLKAQGAHVLSQSEATCTVWGMPRAIEESGLADEILPLHDIAMRINHLAS